jgi:hypothetical protein
MNAPIRTPLGKTSPRELREYKPRLRFNWRCPECKSEWEAPCVPSPYCCGVYAVDADEETDE